MIGRADRSRPLPLSYGQQQMWFLNRLDPDSAEYLVPMALRLGGPLDRPALRTAWSQMSERHEILRTRYEMDGATPVQVIDAPRAVELAEVDLGTLPATEREQRALDLLRQESSTAFDLEREWPLRGTLLRLGDEDHVLVVVFHHIACDAWSTRLFVSELSELYQARVAGRAPQLADPELHYADYAVWQREELSGKTLERELEYWRNRLDGLRPLDLPTDRPRPASRSFHGAEVEVPFPAGLAERVRASAAQHGVTPFVLLLTSYQLLLSRYADQPDIAVGTVVSGRGRPELQSMLGYGINNLVMRSRWDGARSFAELVAVNREAVLGAYDHQGVPFARLVDELEPERDMSRTPLYQVSFTMHESGEAAQGLFGMATSPFGVSGGVAKTDLELQVVDAGEGSLQARLAYPVALFEPATVERMAGHWLRLLDAAVSDPATPVSRLGMLDDTEKALLTAGPRAVAAVERCVHEVFEEQVALDPDAVAVVAGGVELSYGEVDARANRLAGYLVGRGVGPESLVGVCLERGADLVPALLGVLKSGAGYVPLDPVNPAERLGFVASDAGVSLVVTQEGLRPLVEGFHAGPVVVLDGADREGIASCGVSGPGVGGSPSNAVYVIYTSGSTGRPKGVCLEHASVVRLLSVCQEHYAFDESDVFSLFHSYAFDVSVFEMWGALMHGGRVVVVPREVAQSPDDFLDLLVRERVTVLSQTPSAFRSLVAAAADGDGRVERLALRAVVFAGEKLEVGDLQPWVSRLGLGRTALVNMYGITETTVHSTYHRLSEEDFAAEAGNAIGRPLADLSIHLLGSDGELVPVGVPGEIHVGGPGVARGYLGRAGLTAGRFVPDPFGPAGARLYRSGDLARRREDGSLEFLGRIDDQVTIRGYRIELGEIESVLSAHPAFRDAVVVVREDTPGDKRLVAYYVPAPAATVDLASLRTELGRSLPDYMVPAAFVELESLPLTPNGKLDKRSLPAPEQDAFARGAYVAPRTETEARIAAVWSEVLGLEQVGVEDSFFDLGGDSIRAVALVGALRATGIEVAVRDVFAARTVAALCDLLGTQDLPGDAVAVPSVERFALISAEDRAKLPEEVVDAYPLSRTQTGMVVEMLADTSRNHYHNVSTYRIRDDKPFSREAFAEAGRIVVARHETLRTSIDLETYSVPMQLVHAGADPVMGVADLGALDEDAQHETLRAFTAAERARPFALSAPPLMRYFAHTTDTNGWWISVTECHPIMEGWSYHSLLMELLTCYMRLRDGAEPEPYDAPDVRYADFIAGELESLASEEDRAYWRGVVDAHVPFKLPHGWEGTTQGPGEEYALDVATDDLEPRLRALASTADASLKSVLLAAHLKVMSILTDEPAFHTGLVCDARPEVTGADRVYGMYLNTLPVPAARSARTWLELVRGTFAREVELWGHRRFPMPEIQREAGGGRLIDSLFNYQNFHHVDTGKVDTSGSFGNGVTEFALSITASPGRISLQASTRDLARVHGRRILGLFRSVLEAMADDAHGDARASFLPDHERRLVLDTWQGETRDVPERCLHELVEAQAARTPDAVAVVCEATELTYADLNARANRLAHRLRTAGVRADSVVGLCLERSAELVIATLAVSKAGGAYAPLDPEYPADRLAGMVEDMAAPVIVTEQRLRESLPATSAALLCIDDEEQWAAEPAEDLTPTASSDSGAYVVFTSGSTGRPKGVLNTHRGVVNRLDATQRLFRLTADDVVLQKTAAGFDVFTWEIFGTLMAGARLVIATRGGHRDPAYLASMIREHGVTMVDFVPSMLALLLEEGGGLAGCSSLRAIACGGEEMPAPLLRRVLAEVPGAEVFHQYGPSEASIDCTVWPVRGTLPDGLDRLPIGTAMQNIRLYVLGADLLPQPVGIPGELHVGGVAVARGYLRRPALTAERFVPDPHGEPGARMYRTGDRVRWLADGTLEFLGRTDNQVKIRGVRIEPEEIEAALMRLPTVRDAAVLVREDTPGDKRLVAYCVPAAGTDRADSGPASLRAELGRSLPEHMVPAAFVRLERIPVTPNGKADRRALPAPAQEDFARGRYVAPHDTRQERIAAVWSKVLGVDRVGAEDSFFDLGGDSIRAVALVGALRAAGFPATIQQVFEARTVAALSAALTDGPQEPRGITGTEPFALVPPEDRAELPDGLVDAYPLSQVQTGMVAEMLVGGETNAYHTISTVRIRDEKPFVADALREAWRTVAARHEALRTSVHVTDYSRPLQLVHRVADVTLGVRDLGAAGRPETEDALRAFVRAERSLPLDLGVAPLIRLFVHTTDADGWWLSVTSPHVILDGWSHESLLMELLGCYARLRDGLAPEPYEVPAVRYADFIAGELAALDSEEDRAYWRDTIDGFARFTLPAEWGESGRPDESYGVRVAYDDLTDGLREMATALNVPLKSVLLAAHLKVMSMLTDEPAFHTGLVCHARPEAEGADRLIGMQLNTLPFVADRSARTWRELVEQVFAREVELWGHRRFPMPEIQREAGGGRLVDVFFNYQDFRQVDSDLIDPLGGIDDSPTELPLTVSSRGGHIILTVGVPALSQEHGDRIAGMYRAVLEAMASGADGDARAVYLPAGERERLLGEAAGGAAVAAVERCVHEVFEEQVALDPDAVAVVAGGVELSYGEVDARANRLAGYLVGRGVGPESLVGVCLERGADLVPALLGVLKSGAGYVPLDPVNPAERLGFVASDAGVSLVVTQEGLRPLVEGFHAGPVVVLDGADPEGIASCGVSGPGVGVSPSNAVYVIYTSGSTGRPKGVCLEHASVVRLLSVCQEHYAFDESDVFSLFHSYAFDVSVFEMWGALMHGGRVVVVPREVAQSPDDFLDLLVRERVTVLSQTPSAFRSLVAAAADGDGRVERLALRAVVFAGEKLEVGDLQPWVSRLGLGRTALVNMYGITETTVHSTYHRLSEEDFAAEAGNAIGRPLADLSIHLLGSDGELVPVGVPGEIHVGGPGVARGYLGRAGLTAGRFVPDPFGPAGARLYRSGDLARRREDGSLEFLGRIDDQVKIRGYRIELGEIESVLSAHPAFRDAVVVVREDTPGDKRLVAYYVPAPAATVDLASLRTELGRSLPDYMVPAAFVELESLPLTPNGKLDKRSLPAPEQDAFARGAYVAPRTETEARIAAVWSEVLGLEQVGVEDSFFDLGGDSIRAVTLVGALRTTGIETTMQEVFAARTVAALAAAQPGRADEAAEATDRRDTAAVQPFALVPDEDRAKLPGEVVDAYPLSQAQTGMVVEMLAKGGARSYHNVVSLRVRDERFSLDALRQAMAVLTERHEVLRTSIDLETYSVPMQLVHAASETQVECTDLTTLGADETEQALRAFVETESEAVFDLERAPLLRVAVHLCADGSWQFTVTQAHVILDGWSHHSLMAELIGCFRQFRDGRGATPWTPPAVRFADAIAGELAALRSPADRAYWQGVVDGHAKFGLPAAWADAPDTPREQYEIHVGYADLEDSLRELAATAGTSVKSVVHAAHQKVVGMLTDEPTFHTGLTCHIRPEALGAERVHGMYLNVLPFAADRSARSWRELVRQVFARETEVWEHRMFPMPAIQRELFDGDRLIDVHFSYQDFRAAEQAAAADTTGGAVDLAASMGSSSNVFALFVVAGPAGLTVHTHTHAVSRANGERLAQMFRTVLETMSTAPDAAVDATSLLPAGELDRLVHDLNASTVPFDQDASLHELVERQVVVSPGAVAVVGDDGRLSFGELDA
ncbi:amino acid adenylation domain-containing protein, partial [Streptomyces sp. NPDC058964]|uniref:amino acid adenylation domain-containing protein n=1 Tax=Streptomyces sp. NPDC058964 TaxID=3346681 RepID=UPI0036A2E268